MNKFKMILFFVAIIAIIAYIVYKQNSKSKAAKNTNSTNDTTAVTSKNEVLPTINITDTSLRVNGANSEFSNATAGIKATISVINEPSVGVLEVLLNNTPFKTFQLTGATTYMVDEFTEFTSDVVMTAKIGSVSKAVTISAGFGV